MPILLGILALMGAFALMAGEPMGWLFLFIGVVPIATAMLCIYLCNKEE